MLAYLVIREGTKWTDVVRLEAGKTSTIGRASTNKVVIRDERASRIHAELFFSNGAWTIRDLESRNGTLINGESTTGDYELKPQDCIRIANCHISFVNDLSSAFPENIETDTGVLLKHLAADTNEADFDGIAVKIANLEEVDELDGNSSQFPTTITHRKGQTKLLDRRSPSKGVSDAVASLCRIAFELANQNDEKGIADTALEGVFDCTKCNAAALLLAPYDLEEIPTSDDVSVIAWKTVGTPKYHRLTEFLAKTVLEGGEAVLGRDISDDSQIASRDSKGEIASTSIICAPVRYDKQIVGLLHAYSTTGESSLTPDDLEFILALADNVGLALKNVSRAMELVEDLSQSRSEIQQLRSQLEAESEMIGVSSALDQVKQDIAHAAPSRATVLIRGESGVGKELIARAIHFASPRKKEAFVCLNCAALSESLLESELFGHEKGAFTGATERKIGKFEAANLGTLMLDEIGEMSLTVQAKFLRVLEGHTFERLGGNQPIDTNVRVIAATNRDLEVAVAEGEFRRDLYFRLNVVVMLVPPLRKRPEDIELLMHYFLDKFRSETGRKITGFTDEAVDELQNYKWPGNIRELKNIIERAVVLCRNTVIDVGDLSLSNLITSPDTSGIMLNTSSYESHSLEEIERFHIKRTLDYHDWNKSRSASILGIERSTLDRKIKRYKLARPSV
jgi:transcriptional regulator with GAF, ATPase, and Fis domain/pSer/pThr/pTyr-binding forkhead associated (FHA) protein